MPPAGLGGEHVTGEMGVTGNPRRLSEAKGPAVLWSPHRVLFPGGRGTPGDSGESAEPNCTGREGLAGAPEAARVRLGEGVPSVPERGPCCWTRASTSFCSGLCSLSLSVALRPVSGDPSPGGRVELVRQASGRGEAEPPGVSRDPVMNDHQLGGLKPQRLTSPGSGCGLGLVPSASLLAFAPRCSLCLALSSLLPALSSPSLPLLFPPQHPGRGSGSTGSLKT